MLKLSTLLAASISLFGIAATKPPAPVVSTASANVPMPAKPRPGANLSGCEFYAPATLCPTAADVDWYADQGFTAVRLPVKSAQLNAAIPRLQPTVAEALRRGMLVVVDLHDFLPLDAARIGPLIQRLATAFGPEVWIDYDNEPRAPTGVASDKWTAAARATNAIIAGARAAGVANVLVVEWPDFSANTRFPTAASVTTCGSFACALDHVGGLADPLGKSVLGPHRYYDKSKSGTSSSCATTAWYWSAYLADAEARGYKTLIGETAFGSWRGVPASCQATARSVMAEIGAAKSIVAYTVWGGGRAWNSAYLFRLEPTPRTPATSDYVRLLTGR